MADVPFGSFAPSIEQQQGPLTRDDLYAYIRNNQRLRDAFLQSVMSGSQGGMEQGRERAQLQDAAENAWGGGQTLLPNDIRRLLGQELTPQERISDTFLTARGRSLLFGARGNRFTPMGGYLPR